ncbi:hypothetical protein GN244_ATG08421 [Phytophthora infestans]|uniref:Uncharacterized protein n=1 Tax=Phytophthora infestans TaxID=4787 RepID=A0A833TE58_PHYIN|nr:hypothetical protein GN244_ATG08421 [Phytophthora infestans]
MGETYGRDVVEAARPIGSLQTGEDDLWTSDVEPVRTTRDSTSDGQCQGFGDKTPHKVGVQVQQYTRCKDEDGLAIKHRSKTSCVRRHNRVGRYALEYKVKYRAKEDDPVEIGWLSVTGYGTLLDGGKLKDELGGGWQGGGLRDTMSTSRWTMI